MAAYKDLQSRNIYSTPCTFASDIILCVVASLLRCDDAGLGLEMNVFFGIIPSQAAGVSNALGTF